VHGGQRKTLDLEFGDDRPLLVAEKDVSRLHVLRPDHNMELRDWVPVQLIIRNIQREAVLLFDVRKRIEPKASIRHLDFSQSEKGGGEPGR
jgi:hypothetical protein